MRIGVASVVAVVLISAVVVTAPVAAIDRERAQALAEEARAGIGVESVADSVAKAAKVVTVNCSKPGASVQAALDANLGPVTIEIQGICAENVRIERRSDVTLQGKRSDPTKDGLRGVADPTRNTTLEIWYSARVALRDLSFNNAARGVGWYYSSGEISNCDFNDNSSTGLTLGMISWVTARDVEASRNGTWGIRIHSRSVLSCQSCDLIGNAPVARWDRSAVWAEDGGWATFWDSVVSGSRGLVAWGDDSYVDIDCFYGDPAAAHDCSLDVGNGYAGRAQNTGTVGFLAVAFTGNLYAGDGTLDVWGVNQEQGSVSLAGDSKLSIGGGYDKQGNELEARIGPTTLQDWTRATFGDGTVIDNPVTCSGAADAILTGATFEGDGSISGCEHASGP